MSCAGCAGGCSGCKGPRLVSFPALAEQGRAGSEIDFNKPTAAPGRVMLFNLGDIGDKYAREPAMVDVTLRFEPTTTDFDAGTLEVFAELVWTAGRAQQVAEVDVPARGTMFSLTAADGLQIWVEGRGTATGVVGKVFGTLGICCSHMRPAQRSIMYDLPVESGVVRAIPRFARGVRVVATDPTLLANVRVRLLASTDAAAPIISETVADEDNPDPIPAGALGFTLIGAPDVGAHAVFDLQL